MQLNQGKRGFSFMKEGPLDMRMDQSHDLTAEKIVNSWSEKKLSQLFKDSEVAKWKQAAKAVVKAREKKRFETTTELADVIKTAVGFTPKKKVHPATLVFQALRMCVNRELESVMEGLEKALGFLAPRGKVGVLTFQGMEERIVKEVFKEASKPIRKIINHKRTRFQGMISVLTKKPILCSRDEAKKNPRARSAKLRFAQKNELSEV